jgi:hypothetical protein
MEEKVECQFVRKKLRDYAANNITDTDLIKKIENHIEKCIICRRELLLWQDVLQKQEILKKMNVPMDNFKDRIKERMKSLEKNPEMPRLLKQTNTLNLFLTSPKGCLITQLLILTASFLFIMLFFKKGVSFLFILFFLLSLGAMFYLLLKNR